jgi:hypothetical protein
VAGSRNLGRGGVGVDERDRSSDVRREDRAGRLVVERRQSRRVGHRDVPVVEVNCEDQQVDPAVAHRDAAVVEDADRSDRGHLDRTVDDRRRVHVDPGRVLRAVAVRRRDEEPLTGDVPGRTT